jgi:hypothetical protein
MIPPAEFEADHHHQTTPAMLAVPNNPSDVPCTSWSWTTRYLMPIPQEEPCQRGTRRRSDARYSTC